MPPRAKTTGQQAESATTYVALMRGINVGGKNKLPMKELADIFTAAGCQGVRTYIQSGNIVFRASQGLAARVADLVSTLVQDRFGFRVPVITLRADELRTIVRDNPLLRSQATSSTLHVAFLPKAPSPELGASLDHNRSPPDELALLGRAIYLCCPNGMARTKLTNEYFDSRLKMPCTMRNWRTVLTLLAWAEEP